MGDDSRKAPTIRAISGISRTIKQVQTFVINAVNTFLIDKESIVVVYRLHVDHWKGECGDRPNGQFSDMGIIGIIERTFFGHTPLGIRFPRHYVR